MEGDLPGAVQHQRAHEHAQHTAVVMGATGVSQGNFLQEGGLDHSLGRVCQVDGRGVPGRVSAACVN